MFYNRILLMCALKAHINFHFWKKNFSRIEKVMITFSIPEKIFLKIENLMCAFRVHINRTLLYNITTKSLRTCRYLIGYPTNNLTNVEHRESRIP